MLSNEYILPKINIKYDGVVGLKHYWKIEIQKCTKENPNNPIKCHETEALSRDIFKMGHSESCKEETMDLDDVKWSEQK